jgi:hypothetical protein
LLHWYRPVKVTREKSRQRRERRVADDSTKSHDHQPRPDAVLVDLNMPVVSGVAIIPGVDVAALERVFPVVVIAGGTLFQTDLLWSRIEAELPVTYSEVPMKPLTLFDMDGPRDGARTRRRRL